MFQIIREKHLIYSFRERANCVLHFLFDYHVIGRLSTRGQTSREADFMGASGKVCPMSRSEFLLNKPSVFAITIQCSAYACNKVGGIE